MIVVDVVTTKADVIAYYLAVVIANMMFVADVIATKADVVAFCLADVIAYCNICGRWHLPVNGTNLLQVLML